MMLRATWIAILTLLLAGCAAPNRGVVIHSSPPGAVEELSTAPNLVLGPSAEHARLAQLFTQRSSWPAVDAGYRLEEISVYNEVIYDDQTFYDRYGGGYYREAETYRTGVLLR